MTYDIKFSHVVAALVSSSPCFSAMQVTNVKLGHANEAMNFCVKLARNCMYVRSDVTRPWTHMECMQVDLKSSRWLNQHAINGYAFLLN